MTVAITHAAVLVSLAGLVGVAAALLSTGRVTVAPSVVLDLLLAAGLLRLALRPSPVQLAGTALRVLVEGLASFGTREAMTTRPSARPVRARKSSASPAPSGQPWRG